MADAKEDTKVAKDVSEDVKKNEANNTDSDNDSPPVPQKEFEDVKPAVDGGNEIQKEGTTVPPKSLATAESGPGSGDAKGDKDVQDVKEEILKQDDEKEAVSGKAPDPTTDDKKDTPEQKSEIKEMRESTSTDDKKETPATKVQLRDKTPAPKTNNSPRGNNARVSMDECIDEVKKSGGRSSLHMNDDPFDGMTFTSKKTPQLETVLEKLSYVEGRVGQDQYKYIVPRDGITSFVFLAKK